MPARSDDPLRRVTLNLYEADCAKLEAAIGQGWTERVRQVVHQYCETIRIVNLQRRADAPIFPAPRTLGDLDNG